MPTLPFNSETHAARRRELRRVCEGRGLLLFPGNNPSPINCQANHYWFRQDSSFAYLFGLSRPGLAGLIDLDDGSEFLFGNDPGPDELIWINDAPPMVEQAAAVGVHTCLPYESLDALLLKALKDGRTVHYLPPYRAETVLELCSLLGRTSGEIELGASAALTRAIIALREIKEVDEISEIEAALTVTRDMHLAAMRSTRAGMRECEIVAEIEAVMHRHDLHPAYAPIFTRHGEVLHNLSYGNTLRDGDLVVNDSGVSSRRGYASDITRTIPVSGRFSDRQAAVYDVVLAAQLRAIETMAPGVAYRAVHMLAASTIVDGLKSLGLFKGATQDIVASGAYALCFPHGLGHQMGLDVHDMEALGEDQVGYGPGEKRSDLFGLRNLRLAKKLKAGMVLTVEPGIYFIPQLIEAWRAEARFAGLINYDEFRKFVGFGGIRIEDDALITDQGARILGPPIPKTCVEVQAAMHV